MTDSFRSHQKETPAENDIDTLLGKAYRAVLDNRWGDAQMLIANIQYQRSLASLGEPATTRTILSVTADGSVVTADDATGDEFDATFARLKQFIADPEPLAQASPAAPSGEPGGAVTDTERLDFLIDWFSSHDDWKGSGVRDWDDNADARAAIDAARLHQGEPKP